MGASERDEQGHSFESKPEWPTEDKPKPIPYQLNENSVSNPSFI